MSIPTATKETIHGVWDTLATFPAADSEQALKFLLKEISDIINAQNANWIVLVRVVDDRVGLAEQKKQLASDPYFGWRPVQLAWLNESPALMTAYKDHTGTVKRVPIEPNESTLKRLKQAGVFRSTLLKNHVSPAFYKSATYEAVYLNSGFSDALFVAAPVGKDVEIFFSFMRNEGQPEFTSADLEIATYTLRSLLWFHKQVLLSYGVRLGSAPLTQTERKVLNLLLTANSEPQIAKILSQQKATTHQHVTRIFRKFNVTSRAALTALWLGSS